MNKSTERILREFVAKRIDFIRTGNREGLDSTYRLFHRNEYNCHDYDWYIRQIEFGFGAEVQKFEIQQVTSETPLPLANLVTYPWPPEYIVFLTAVNQRRTVWLVSIDIEDGEPKVVLPAFGGRVGDAIVCGELVPSAEDRQTEPEVVFCFDADLFAHELAHRIYLELNGVKTQLLYDEIRALSIDCFPWHGSLHLSILTGREDFCEEDDDDRDFGKWSTAEWRYNDFTSTPNENWPYAKDLTEQMTAYYNSGDNRECLLRADNIFRACAKALLSPTVSRALEFYGFNLSADFEFGVIDPDHPSKGNYCSIVGNEWKN
jgi:hypothetical protein